MYVWRCMYIRRNNIRRIGNGASKLTQWVVVPAAKTDNLGLSPRTSMAEGEKGCVLTTTCLPQHVCAHVHTHK